jgi:hypothetical protein
MICGWCWSPADLPARGLHRLLDRRAGAPGRAAPGIVAGAGGLRLRHRHLGDPFRRHARLSAASADRLRSRLTLLSILVAMLITGGTGWWLRCARALGGPSPAGAVIGGGIGTMHYIGMAAVKLAGRFVWDRSYRRRLGADRHRRFPSSPSLAERPPPAAASSPWPGRHRSCSPSPSAACISPPWAPLRSSRPEPRRAGRNRRSAASTLGVAVTRWRWSSSRSASRSCCSTASSTAATRGGSAAAPTFADAAIEGLVVIDGDRIVDANRSFLR